MNCVLRKFRVGVKGDETVEAFLAHIIEHVHQPGQTVQVLSDDEARAITSVAIERKAAGRRVVVSPLLFWSDETGGNFSKKYDKFESVFVRLAGLSPEVALQSTMQNFVCTANRGVTILDMTPELRRQLDLMQTGFFAWDGHKNEEVFVVAPLFGFSADNPRAAELSSHLGVSANAFCRHCDVLKSDPMAPSRPRNTQTTLAQLREIEETYDDAKKKELVKSYAVKTKPNALLHVKNFNANWDIFEDILHWINLGLTKYFAQVVKTALHGKTGEQVVLQRMRDLDWSAFDYRLTSNPVRYCGSYQGKDFQALVQVAPFLFDGLIPEQDLALWVQLSEVVTVLMKKSINLSTLSPLRDQLRYIATRFVELHPSFAKKFKLHLCLHAVDSLLLAGSLRLVDSGVFESTNRRLRYYNMFSNKKNPSRDICARFADEKTVMYLLDGVVFQRQQDGAFITFYVGDSIQELFKQQLVRKMLRTEEPDLSQSAIFRGKVDRKKRFTIATSLDPETAQLVIGLFPSCTGASEIVPYKAVRDSRNVLVGLRHFVLIESVHKIYMITSLVVVQGYPVLIGRELLISSVIQRAASKACIALMDTAIRLTSSQDIHARAVQHDCANGGHCPLIRGKRRHEGINFLVMNSKVYG